MILVVAAAAWLAALVFVRFAATVPSHTRRQLQVDVAAIGAIAAATLGFFWRLVFTANVWMPAGGGDLSGFLYPTYHFAAEWWRRGVIPLWNPHLFAGQPFVGDIQSGIFYPINLLTFLVSTPLNLRDMELLSVLHYMIAGAGMYGLLRWGNFQPRSPSNVPQPEGEPANQRNREGRASSSKEHGFTDAETHVSSPQAQVDALPEAAYSPSGEHLSRAACLAGALAFEFSDLFITHFGNLNLIATAAWLPLVFLFFMRAVDRAIERQRTVPSPSFAVDAITPSFLSGVFLAVAFLAGHIQSFLFIVLTLVLYALYRVIESRREAVRIMGVLGVTLLVGLGLSAVVLVPSTEMARESVRSAFTYEDAAQYSLPPAELVGLFVPGFFGRGPQAAWGPWPRVEVGYLGVFPLILAALAIVMRKSSKALFFALLAVAGLVLALGGYAIVHGWLYEFVPGFGQLRAPARFILLLDFGLAVLAALGFDTLLHPLIGTQNQTFREISREAPWVLLIVALTGGGVALAILILGQGQDPVLFARIANGANSLAFFILLLAFSTALLRARERNFLSVPVWSTLALALIFFDLFSLGAYVDIGLSDPTAAYDRQDVVDFLQSQGGMFRIDSRTDVEGSWLPDTALLYGLYDVNGDNPLVLSDSDRFWQSIGSRAARAYDLLNIHYVLARRSTPLDEKFQRVFDAASGITAYENRNALPRAWIVYASYPAPDRVQALEQVHSPQFDPRAVAFVEGARAPELGVAHVPSDEAQVVGYGPNEIDLSATAKQRGYLILSEVYYPGWRAIVDDRETEIFRGDYLFRAVFLPAGEHRVRMIYDPLSFKLGAVVSGLTLLGLIGCAIYVRRTARQ